LDRKDIYVRILFAHLNQIYWLCTFGFDKQLNRYYYDEVCFSYFSSRWCLHNL